MKIFLGRCFIEFKFFRYYEVDTGQCKPKKDDNWWITTNEDNIMKNYLQIKRWGPTANRLAKYIKMDTLW